jgi:hypothetical protein
VSVGIKVGCFSQILLEFLTAIRRSTASVQRNANKVSLQLHQSSRDFDTSELLGVRTTFWAPPVVDGTPWSMDTLNTNSLRRFFPYRRILLRSGLPRAAVPPTVVEYFFLRKLIRLSPVPNSVQYDIPAKDVIAQPVVSRPDAPLSLARFQARQLFDIVPTRPVIRVLRKDIEKPVENA